MSWRTQYLANLMMLVDADAELTNEEFLALRDIEKKLRTRLEQHMEAAESAGTDPSPRPVDLSVNRNLFDLFVLAYVDEVYSQKEADVIEEFVMRADIPAARVEEIRESAKVAARTLIRRIVSAESGGGTLDELG